MLDEIRQGRGSVNVRPDVTSDFPALTYAWYVVGVLLIVYSVAFVDRIILNLLVRPVRTEMGLSDSGISLLQGFAFTIFYSIFGIILGRLADRRNRQRMAIAGIVVWCVATVACGFAHNFWQLFAARILVGAGEAALSPAAYSIICDSFRREHRSRAISVYSMGVFVGLGCALVFGGLVVNALLQTEMVNVPLVGTVSSWRASFMAVGVPGLLAALLVLTVKEPSRKEVTRANSSFGDTLAFLKTRFGALGSVIFANSLVALINYSISAWLPSYFVRVYGWTAGSIAAAYGIILLTAGCAGVLVGGWLADRLVTRGRADGIVHVMRWSMVLLVPSAGWIGFVHSPGLALGVLAWATFLLGIPTGLGPAAVNAITPNQYRGQTIAVYLLAAALIGLGAGPTLVALGTDYVFHSDAAVGWSLGMVITVASAVSAVTLLAGRRSYNEALDGTNEPIGAGFGDIGRLGSASPVEQGS